MASEDYRVDYAEITRIYRTLRGDVLTEIPSDFYRKASDYITSLEKAEEEARSSNKELLHTAQTQIREARKLLGNIWEFRTRKLALMAVSQRKGTVVEQKGLSSEEEEFLSSMISVVRQHEQSSLHGRKTGGGADGSMAPAPVKPVDEKRAVEPVREMREPVAEKQAKEEGGLVLVRFLENVPRFATEYGEFEMKKEDVAFLPEAYSRVLVDRKVAVRIEGR